jgi:acyl carrier protein
MNKQVFNELVISAIKSNFGHSGDITKDTTWTDVGWINDSLDETVFILELEKILKIEILDRESIKFLYKTDTKIFYFIESLYIELNLSQ